MEGIYTGFKIPTKEEFDSLWSNEKTVFVIDANVLLSLFKIRTEQQDLFLHILSDETLKGRLWIPHEVGYLYMEKRNSRITDEINNVTSAMKDFQNFIDKAIQPGIYPYIDRHFLRRIAEVKNDLGKALKRQKEDLRISIKESRLKTKIDQLFPDEKVGKSYELAKMEELYRRGEERYSKKRPPGYLSSYGEDNRLRFHDYIVWKQMQEFAGSNDRDVIMVRGMATRDWFAMDGDNVISPNPSIVYEFHIKTLEDYQKGHTFYCLSILQFINECVERQIIQEPGNNFRKNLVYQGNRSISQSGNLYKSNKIDSNTIEVTSNG